MLPDRRLIRMIDVPSPLRRVRVVTLPQARKQREFQMIVRVDQPGHDLQAFEIQGESLNSAPHFPIPWSSALRRSQGAPQPLQMRRAYRRWQTLLAQVRRTAARSEDPD